MLDNLLVGVWILLETCVIGLFYTIYEIVLS